MKELNLEVGQKVWTIQSGYCVLIEIDKDEEYCFITLNKQGRSNCYDKFGMYGDDHFYPSLFESNPFEEKANLDGVREIYGLKESTLEKVSQPENKAELINSLVNLLNQSKDTIFMSIDTRAVCKEIAETKLQKLLESL